MKIAFPFSLNIVFWTIIGIIRYYSENIINTKKYLPSRVYKQELAKVAVCIPAHNEEEIIERTISNIGKSVPVGQIYVVSDGSTDRTAQIALDQKCNVMVLLKSQGKAKALKELITNFNLTEKYKYIIFCDSDTTLDANYMQRALRYMYYHPETAVLTTHAVPYWRDKTTFAISDFISAYRTRLYKILQIAFMYGMTWKYINVNAVIPGFAALYRSDVLNQLELDTKGIWIEDFNLAFQVHKKKLGTIGYQPGIRAVYQDPQTIEDYWNQVSRWNVGFFQTVRKHGFWPSLFWPFLFIFTAELILFSMFILAIPVAVFIFILSQAGIVQIDQSSLFSIIFPFGYLFALEVLVSLLIFDYLLTIIIALKDKKYRLIFYGLFFVFFQFLNSLILVSSLKTGLFGESKGTWTHAKRRPG